MKREHVEGWGTPFLKTRSDFAEAMYEMNGKARKERWDDERYEIECNKVNALNLSKIANDRVFEDDKKWYED